MFVQCLCRRIPKDIGHVRSTVDDVSVVGHCRDRTIDSAKYARRYFSSIHLEVVGQLIQQIFRQLDEPQVEFLAGFYQEIEIRCIRNTTYT